MESWTTFDRWERTVILLIIDARQKAAKCAAAVGVQTGRSTTLPPTLPQTVMLRFMHALNGDLIQSIELLSQHRLRCITPYSADYVETLLGSERLCAVNALGTLRISRRQKVSKKIKIV